MIKFLCLLLLTTAAFSSAGQEIKKDLKRFNKIISSPKINVILERGDRESIRLVHPNVNSDKINIAVRRKTLYVYLDDARKTEKTIRSGDKREGIYEGVTITAYVTYRDIELLEVRGNQNVNCNDPIISDKFRLRAYGENKINLSSLKTEFFKASLYGENTLKIEDGKVLEQRYRLYGENKIDTREMRSEYTSTSIFGEGRLNVNSSEKVRIDAFGEPEIYVDGGGSVNKRLIIGKAEIFRQ